MLETIGFSMAINDNVDNRFLVLHSISYHRVYLYIVYMYNLGKLALAPNQKQPPRHFRPQFTSNSR